MADLTDTEAFEWFCKRKADAFKDELVRTLGTEFVKKSDFGYNSIDWPNICFKIGLTVPKSMIASGIVEKIMEAAKVVRLHEGATEKRMRLTDLSDVLKGSVYENINPDKTDIIIDILHRENVYILASELYEKHNAVKKP